VIIAIEGGVSQFRQCGTNTRFGARRATFRVGQPALHETQPGGRRFAGLFMRFWPEIDPVVSRAVHET
jgi:hypothetical protein